MLRPGGVQSIARLVFVEKMPLCLYLFKGIRRTPQYTLMRPKRFVSAVNVKIHSQRGCIGNHVRSIRHSIGHDQRTHSMSVTRNSYHVVVGTHQV